jgi:hypothetical protein
VVVVYEEFDLPADLDQPCIGSAPISGGRMAVFCLPRGDEWWARNDPQGATAVEHRSQDHRPFGADFGHLSGVDRTGQMDPLQTFVTGPADG